MTIKKLLFLRFVYCNMAFNHLFLIDNRYFVKYKQERHLIYQTNSIITVCNVGSKIHVKKVAHNKTIKSLNIILLPSLK